jgi:hypothetical protein
MRHTVAASWIQASWISPAAALLAVLALALWLAPAGQAQDDMGMGSDHDAGDMEMLTGETAQPMRRPSAPQPTEEAAPAELSYTTRLDRTAVWVGDVFHYQILVDHSPTIEFVLENLNKDTLLMEPLRVVDLTKNEVPLKNGNLRLIVDVSLVSFTVGVEEQPLPQVTLFYFRRDQGTTGVEEAAAESLTVPGPVIGLRSTLPPEAADLRDAITVSGWPRSRWIIAGLGWTALIVLLAGAGWEGAMAVRYRKGRRGPDPRKAMAAINNRWNQSLPSDYSDPQRVMDFYGRSYADLKEYLGYLLEAPTEGLTAEDLQGAGGRIVTNPEIAERAARVLETCETARYGRNGTAASPDAARAVERDMRQIFEIGARS